MSSVKLSVIFMTAQRYYAMVLNFAVMAIASRLLRPEEIGLAVVGSMIAMMVLSLRDFASSHYLVQKPELSQEDRRSATSFITLITLAAAAVLAVAAPWIAEAYGEPILLTYVRLVAVCACLEALFTPILGLMQREMAFGRVAIITSVQVSLAAIITLLCAATGFSTMSFAWAWFASALSGALAALYFWRDYSIYRPTIKGWGKIVIFGGYYGANQILAKIYESVPTLLLGRFSSMGAVGYYNRALTISQLPDKVFLSGVVAVAIPAFSAKNRAERSLKGPYLRGVSYITALQWPALVSIAILAYPIVEILLGSQWRETASLIQIVALALLFSFSFELNAPILIAVGAMRELFLRALIIWPTSAIILSFGAWYGAKAVAWCLCIVIPFQAYVSIRAVRKHIDVSWREIALALKPSAMITALCAAPPLAIIAASGFRFEMPILEGLGLGVVIGLSWLAGLWLTGHALLGEINRAASTIVEHFAGRRKIS